MPDDNRISAELLDADKTAILTKIDEIFGLLPFLVNLTGDEKGRIQTIGAERAAMEQDFEMQIAAHPELVPGFLDTTELDKDAALRTSLKEIRGRVLELAEGLEDTLHLTGADKMVAYSTFYASVKEAAKRNVVGADTVLAILSQYFTRGGGSPPPSPPPPSPPPPSPPPPSPPPPP